MSFRLMIREPYDRDCFDVRFFERRGTKVLEYRLVQPQGTNWWSWEAKTKEQWERIEDPLFSVPTEIAQEFFQRMADELYRMGFHAAPTSSTDVLAAKDQHIGDLKEIISNVLDKTLP